ncbi:MAG: DsbE family thiol:disulfide interchange protein [Thiogranum sp.]|jgi:cytochrome c biogenesis protein CcmG/thiol:disulfide interchange protein DsbE|nr:DsbE family thiol:disulfide interchange protein [Thiogranum sp.]
MPRFVRYLLPLVLFLAMAGLLYRGLSIDPRLVPSPLVGKSAPAFSLARLEDPAATLSNADFKGQVSLLNVWATWCVSCRAEHQVLMQLSKSTDVAIYGLNYKDERPAALRWLQQFGDPYRANAFDADGRVGIDWGVYGTPETFIIDKQGVIRHKHTGPLTWDIVQHEIMPLVKQLQAETG